MNVTLHIERVVLEGVQLDPAEREHVRRALEQELTTALEVRGLRSELAAGAALPRLAARDVTLGPGAGGAGVGRSMGAALADSIACPGAIATPITQAGGP